jgi:hypothetical protein
VVIQAIFSSFSRDSARFSASVVVSNTEDPFLGRFAAANGAVSFQLLVVND